jgi:hypothetical protein
MIDKNRDFREPEDIRLQRLRLKRSIRKLVELTEAVKARQRE